MVDGPVEQPGDTVLVQRAHDGTAPALAHHRAQVVQQPQPVRAGRPLQARPWSAVVGPDHGGGLCEVVRVLADVSGTVLDGTGETG
ncbi:hypothetical protein ACR6C2_39230 [Streptomyces sp. INA 01156]